MNLYERLKDNYKEMLIKQADNYPAMTDSVVTALQSTDYVRDLMVGEAIALIDLVNKFDTQVYGLYDFFNDRD